MEDIASDEKEDCGTKIKGFFSIWNKKHGFIEKIHSDKAVNSLVFSLFNDNVLRHFKQISKRRQKQISLDRCHTKHTCPVQASPVLCMSTDSEVGSIDKRPKREAIRNSILIPMVLMKEIFAVNSSFF